MHSAAYQPIPNLRGDDVGQARRLVPVVLPVRSMASLIVELPRSAAPRPARVQAQGWRRWRHWTSRRQSQRRSAASDSIVGIHRQRRGCAHRRCRAHGCSFVMAAMASHRTAASDVHAPLWHRIGHAIAARRLMADECSVLAQRSRGSSPSQAEGSATASSIVERAGRDAPRAYRPASAAAIGHADAISVQRRS